MLHAESAYAMSRVTLRLAPSGKIDLYNSAMINQIDVMVSIVLAPLDLRTCTSCKHEITIKPLDSLLKTV